MSDGIAPAIDKVGPPAPGAPEAQAQAPTLSLGNGVPTQPATANHEKLEVKNPDPPKTTLDGAGPAVSHLAPKPVEVMSVPETPINGTTPLGQSPRPELTIPVDPPLETPNAVDGKTIPPDSAVLKVNDDSAAAHPTPPSSLPKDEGGSEEVSGAPTEQTKEEEEAEAEEKPKGVTSVLPVNEPAPGAKRKVDTPTNGDHSGIEKKAKTTPENVNGGAAGEPKKAGRPKKDTVKKVIASVVGKTQRKTRSQGPAEDAK